MGKKLTVVPQISDFFHGVYFTVFFGNIQFFQRICVLIVGGRMPALLMPKADTFSAYLMM